MRTGRPPKLSPMVAYQIDRGINRQQLSFRTGIGIQHLSRYSTGSMIPTITVAIRIANALDCKPRDLFDRYMINGTVCIGEDIHL